METIHVALDEKLLQATDRAARQTKRSRSALVRDALREHLRRLEIRSREERDRQGYTSQPSAREESLVWEAAGRFAPLDLDEVAGCLKSKRKSKTTSQVDTAIRREVIRRHDRGRY